MFCSAANQDVSGCDVAMGIGRAMILCTESGDIEVCLELRVLNDLQGLER